MNRPFAVLTACISCVLIYKPQAAQDINSIELTINGTQADIGFLENGHRQTCAVFAYSFGVFQYYARCLDNPGVTLFPVQEGDLFSAEAVANSDFLPYEDNEDFFNHGPIPPPVDLTKPFLVPPFYVGFQRPALDAVGWGGAVCTGWIKIDQIEDRGRNRMRIVDYQISPSGSGLFVGGENTVHITAPTLTIRRIEFNNELGIEITFEAKEAVAYQLQASSNAIDWNSVDEPIVGSGDIASISHSTVGDALRFFRLVMTE